MIESKHFVYRRLILPDVDQSHRDCCGSFEGEAYVIVAKEALTKRGRLRKGWSVICAYMPEYEPTMEHVIACLMAFDERMKDSGVSK